MEFFSLAFFEGKESDPPSRALATEGWGTNPGSQDRGVRQGHCTPVLYVILKHSLPEQGRTFFIVCVCVCVCVCMCATGLCPQKNRSSGEWLHKLGLVNPPALSTCRLAGPDLDIYQEHLNIHDLNVGPIMSCM